MGGARVFHYFDQPLCTCRHVILPKDLAAMVPRARLMTEVEWRKLGVQQSKGWVHYMLHRPGKVRLLTSVSKLSKTCRTTHSSLPSPKTAVTAQKTVLTTLHASGTTYTTNLESSHIIHYNHCEKLHVTIITYDGRPIIITMCYDLSSPTPICVLMAAVTFCVLGILNLQ